MGVVENEPTAVTRQDEDMAAVRLRQELLVEDELRGPLGDEPSVEEGRLLEPLGRADEVVGRRDDGLARSRLGLEDVHQLLLGPSVDARDGLVEEVQLWIGGDRTSE